MQIIPYIVFLLVCLPLSAFSQGSRQAEQIISKHTVVFNEPPKRIPNRSAVDAPLLGNGFTGIALSGNPEAQVFYLSRNDFWRLRSALDESFPLVLGKIELSIPGLQGASYRVEQNLYDAVTTARFDLDGRSVFYKAWLSATDDIFVVEIGMTGSGTLEGTAKLSLPGKKEIQVKLPFERAFPYMEEVKILPNGISYLSRACEDSVDIKTKAAMAMNVSGSRDGSFILSEGKIIRLTCSFSSNFKSKDCTAEVIKRVTDISPASIGKIEENHKKWWKAYWEKSFVSIPDRVIEKQYYRSLYGIACSSRDPQFPPSIFGNWITAERPNWNGDYHLNYNHEAPYYALYSANRIEQAEPYYAPLLAQISRGKYYSEKITGVKNGIMLPVGIGPLGIETTRRSPFMEENFKDWIESKAVEDEGMFWGQKSNSAYATVNLSMQFYHTWDTRFAKKVYPFVKGVATFWEGYLTWEDGRYVIYNDAIHEGTNGDKNPVLTLGLVKKVMQTAIDMSKRLGVDKKQRDKWTYIRAHISGYPVQEKEGKRVFRYTETGPAWWNDNTLGIQHIYPAGQIGLDSDPELLQTARNTIDVMQRWSDYNGSNSFFPAAVRVGYNADTILVKLREYSLHTYPNGYQLNNPHGIENLSTVPNTINEMLCMGHQGVVRLFPVWPRDKGAFFSNIRVEGAFLVSGELQNGKVTYLSIVSEEGRNLCLQNPWPGHKVKVMVNGIEHTTAEGERINIKTKANTNYRFVPEVDKGAL